MGLWKTLGILGAVVVGILLVAACSEDEDESFLPDQMKEIRDDPVFKEQAEELRTLQEDCISGASKIECLSGFEQRQEKAWDACFELLDGGELCTLEAEIIADIHGWRIPSFERDSRLLSDPDFLDSTSECIENTNRGFCFALFVVRAEDSFDLCSDFWGGDDCAEVLGEILAHARYEEAGNE